jgi:tetratricopeptide (TPR) repeat protein
MAHYSAKLDDLYQSFALPAKGDLDPLSLARELFSWLWEVKPSRYKPGGSYRLTDVIDAQMRKKSGAVGNCLGLTLLYNLLLRRGGIVADALYMENAFGLRPHVLTLFRTDNTLLDIEHSLPAGFDYKGHLSDPSRIIWGDRALVADIYHSRGNELFERGELKEALKNYNMAIDLNPEYERAHLNRTILLDKLGKRE